MTRRDSSVTCRHVSRLRAQLSFLRGRVPIQRGLEAHAVLVERERVPEVPNRAVCLGERERVRYDSY